MTKLDEQVTMILSGMAMIPKRITDELMTRLGAVQEAIADDMLEQGSTVVRFVDRDGDMMVLTLTVKLHFAHLDVSTSRDAVVVSHGYDVLYGDEGADTVIDRALTKTAVDHRALMAAHDATTDALASIDAARKLMRTHPAFKNMQ